MIKCVGIEYFSHEPPIRRPNTINNDIQTINFTIIHARNILTIQKIKKMFNKKHEMKRKTYPIPICSQFNMTLNC